MKVLTIMSKLEMGGIEKTLLSCIPHLKDAGVEMSILCSSGGVLDKEFKNLGVNIIDFGKHKRPFKDALFLKSILLAEKFDIVHSRYGHTSGLFAKVCNNLKVPFIVSIHNERAMFRNNWIGKPILSFLRQCYLTYHKNLTLKYASKIIGHSKTNLKYYTQDVNNISPQGKFEIIYNGVDFEKFDNYPPLEDTLHNNLNNFLKDGSKVFVHVGSFKEQKNHLFLIDVFEKLKPNENGYKLILLGTGSLVGVVKDYVKNLKLNEYVFFAGMQQNISPFLAKSDLFVFPSIYEGFGNVLIEAQYNKLLIAASNIGPHREATQEFYHSFLFDPHNIDDAVQKISEVLKVVDENRLLEAREFAEKFSIRNMVNDLLKNYNQY